MNQIIGLIIALFMINKIGCCQSMDDWHLERDQNNIRVFSRHLTKHRLKEIRVQCTFQGTLATLVSMLTDIENYPKILYKTKVSRLLARVGETEFYYYIETELPWPIANRDMNVHLTISQDPVTRILRIEVAKAAEGVEPLPTVVRIADWFATWEVRPQTNQQLLIDYQCRLNPGGTLPAWLVNLTASSGPYESFKQLRNHMQDARYQGHKFSFLTE